MIINHNMNAVNANRMMATNIGKAGKSMEKLSSGLRINKAGDDAAGLAISEKMRAQIRGLDQANRNSQDGISMIQTAEGALNETTSILQRMRELATQAGNDTNTSEDRGQIQNEINQLTSEINRIGNTTEFNTQKVLDGGDSARKADAGKAPTVDIKAVTEGKAAVGTAATAGKVEGTVDLTSGIADAKQIKIAVDGAAAVEVTFTGATDAAKIAEQINTQVGKDIATINADGKLELQSDTTGASSSIKVEAGTTDGSALLGLTAGGAAVTGDDASADYAAGVAGEHKFTAGKLEEGQSYSLDGKALEVTGEGADALKTAIEADTDLAAKYEVTVSGEEVTLKQKAGQESATAPNMEIKTAESEEEGFTATLQIGANKGQGFQISIGDMRSEALGITQKAAGDSETKVEAVTEGKAAVGTAATAGKVEGTVDLTSGIADAKQIKIAVDGAAAVEVTFTGATDAAKIAEQINTQVGKDIATINADGKLELQSDTTGASSSIKVEAGTTDGSALLGLTAGGAAVTGDDASADYAAGVAGEHKFTAGKLEEGQSYSLDGKALEVTGEGADALKTAIEADAELAAKYEVTVSGEEVTLKQKAGQESATAPKVEVKTAGSESEVAFTKDPSVTNGTDSNNVESALDVSTHDNATNAIEVLNNAINKVSTERSKLGAFQNRLEHTINNLGTASENLTAAESRIRDVDMAKEMMEFSKNNILQQASQAMLAQAKQAPQGVLQLLR